MAPKEAAASESQRSVRPGRSGWDVLLLVATAAGVLLILALITAVFARSVLTNSWIRRIPADLLALFTVVAILSTMVLCFVAFFRGRRDARRPTLPPDAAPTASVKPYPEHAVVRILVAKADEKKRPVMAGAIGTIVHVHPTPPTASPAYVVEVVLLDKQGVQIDAHVFDAHHEELELCPEPCRKELR